MLLTFKERADLSHSSFSKALFSLMENKQSNLALSADVLNTQELLQLADTLGPEIAILKTHIDILRDFSHDFIKELQQLAEKHQFFLFEDRKFADIGQTVKSQYSEGIYRISDWAHLTNAHALPGHKQIASLAEIGVPKGRGLLLIAEMSAEGHLLTKSYQEQTVEIAKQYPQFVSGFITQHKLSDQHPEWINLAPGIHVTAKKDMRGQQYVTPEHAILQQGIDIIIVGRGITAEKEPVAASRLYREAGWSAYKKRV